MKTPREIAEALADRVGWATTWSRDDRVEFLLRQLDEVRIYEREQVARQLEAASWLMAAHIARNPDGTDRVRTIDVKMADLRDEIATLRNQLAAERKRANAAEDKQRQLASEKLRLEASLRDAHPLVPPSARVQVYNGCKVLAVACC